MWEAEGRGVTGRNPAECRHLCAGGILELKGSANPLMSSASTYLIKSEYLLAGVFW